MEWKLPSCPYRDFCVRSRNVAHIALSPHTPDCTKISDHVLTTIFEVEVLQAKVDNTVNKILPTQVCDTSRRLDLKDTILERLGGDII